MAKLLNKHKKLVHAIAEKNTIRDKEGNIVFDKDDPWVKDAAWDTLYANMVHSDFEGIQRENKK